MWGRIACLIFIVFRMTAQPDYAATKIPDEKERADFLEAVEQNPMRFFCPNGAQERYIRAVAESLQESKIPVILLTYPNGLGKTTATIHIILNFIYGVQSGWFDYHIFQNFPYPKKFWYCSTAESIRDTIEPMIESFVLPQLYPEKEYTTAKDGKTIISRMMFPGGWDITYKTFDQDPKTYESATVGLIVADEPMPGALWKAVKSRRRMGCIVLLPMTPLYCDPYIIDEVYEGAQKEKRGYYHLKADIYEACQRRGTRGHLDPDIIDDMVANYDPDERQARAYGEFAYFSGRIYDALNRDIHYVDPEEYPIPPHSHIFQVVDPHDSRPSAAIWAALTLPIDGDVLGRFIIFDEAPVEKTQQFWDMKRGQSYDDEVKTWAEIEKKYKDLEILEFSRILDRRFGWQTRGQTTLAELYWKAGVRIQKDFSYIASYQSSGKEGEIQVGHNEVRRALQPLADGKPGLVIWNTCYHTWQGLTHYIRKHDTTKLASDRPSGEGKIVQKYKDYPDCVRFLTCTRITPDEPVKDMTESEKKWDRVKHPEKYAHEYDHDLSWQEA